MIRNLFGGSKCRTIDVCDIFGDGSGKALYRLDGNANDESGNYHGTETAITYGGGVYERGAVFNGSSSKITMTAPITSAFTLSFWIKTSVAFPVRNNAIIGLNSASATFITSSDATDLTGLSIHHPGLVEVGFRGDSLLTGTWRHVVLTCSSALASTSNQLWYVDNVLKTGYISGSGSFTFGQLQLNPSSLFNGSIDQVRIFNRAITATEVATLYAECAPTSTVDNINPFEDGSLKALYQFNGDATDKTGVYNGTATSVTYGTGKFGQCAVSNGSTSVVTTSYTPSTNIMSISGWVKSTSIATGQGVVSCNNGSSTAGGVSIDILTSQFRVGVSGASNWVLTQNVGATLLSNQWYHFTFTMDGSIVKFYIDGALVYTSGALSPKIATIPFTILDTGNNTPLIGNLDQLRIFNKALTPMEVASLYNETTPLEEPMHSLVDPFKDGSGKALYRLDGNALDESGNYNGTATSVTYGAGRFGRAGVFNGASSVIQTTYNPATISTAFSASVWIKSSVNGYGIFSNAVAGVNDGHTLDNAVGNARFKSVGRIPEFSSTVSVTTGEWVHIVVTWDGTLTTGAVKMYINGVLNNTTTATAINTGYSAVTYIGRYGTNANYFNGSIDQERFFNRALTASEVTALYQEI